jgi:hypothetical protein
MNMLLFPSATAAHAMIAGSATAVLALIWQVVQNRLPFLFRFLLCGAWMFFLQALLLAAPLLFPPLLEREHFLVLTWCVLCVALTGWHLWQSQRRSEVTSLAVLLAGQLLVLGGPLVLLHPVHPFSWSLLLTAWCLIGSILAGPNLWIIRRGSVPTRKAPRPAVSAKLCGAVGAIYVLSGSLGLAWVAFTHQLGALIPALVLCGEVQVVFLLFMTLLYYKLIQPTLWERRTFQEIAWPRRVEDAGDTW